MFGSKDRQDEKPRTHTAPTPTPSARSASSDAITAYLGPDTQIEGTLRFENSVLIEGRFSGQIESDNGSLVIGEKAEVEADIRAGHITVRGKVTGSITATTRVHLQDRGSFSGELTTPSLQMDESVTFDGRCQMPQTGESPRRTSSPNRQKKNPQEKILEAVDAVKS